MGEEFVSETSPWQKFVRLQSCAVLLREALQLEEAVEGVSSPDELEHQKQLLIAAEELIAQGEACLLQPVLFMDVYNPLVELVPNNIESI